MALKPMLFNTEMTRAILSGQKTCTRRVLKPQPPATSYVKYRDFLGYSWAFWEDSDPHWIKPPATPGDILYVRETWATDADGEYVYRTNYGTTEDDSFPPSMFKWRPSIHMPKEAARIFLRVTDVRVERLQYITRDGAISEGCNAAIPLLEFQGVWDSTFKPADLYRYGWVANPWVWVIRFERISKEAALGGAGNG